MIVQGKPVRVDDPIAVGASDCFAAGWVTSSRHAYSSSMTMHAKYHRTMGVIVQGMLVRVEDPIAVGASDRFAAGWVVSNRGACSSGFNSRMGISASPETNDFNPERIQLVSSPAVSKPGPITVGDSTAEGHAQVNTFAAQLHERVADLEPRNPHKGPYPHAGITCGNAGWPR